MSKQPILLDIDTDFMWKKDWQYLEWDELPGISITGKTLGRHLKRFKGKDTKVFIVIDHHQALYWWDKFGIKNAYCIHIDAHHDMWATGTAQSRRIGNRTRKITCGNYLQQALIDNIVQQVLYVPPDYKTCADELKDLRSHSAIGYRPTMLSRIRLQRWKTFVKQKPSKADIITIAISPEWSPRKYWKEIQDLCSTFGVSIHTMRHKYWKANTKWEILRTKGYVRYKDDYAFPYSMRKLSPKTELKTHK